MIEQDGNSVRSSRFVRMPEIYGSWLCTWVPHTAVSIATSGIVTGPMDMPNERTAKLVRTPWMVDVSMQATWWLPVGSAFNLGLTLAVLNVFDVFQRDIEQGPLRDGTYSYGPVRPRSIRLGLTTGMGLR
jgi:outer membrane receptor for ferrienterochelin and colicins